MRLRDVPDETDRNGDLPRGDAWDGPGPTEEFDSRTYKEHPARIEFREPVPASQLQVVDMSQAAIWPGYLYRGTVTLFAALWKIGKTTLLGHLLARTSEGGELCGLEVAPCKVLVISEEPAGLWAERRDRLGIRITCISLSARSPSSPHSRTGESF
jgi:hypothetical protein